MADLNMGELYTEEPELSFEPVPSDDYIAVISDSEKKVTAEGAKERLNLTWDIVDGNFKGRKVWEGLNIKNPNTKTEIIARRSLSEITRIAQINPTDLVDSAQLHSIPMKIRVVAIDKNDGYGMKNEVKRHFALDDNSSVPAPAAAPASKTATPAKGATVGKKKQPWEK